ncbi:4-hydroxy-tetrahydrodipicolinate reductase [Candidatus Syntrophocurvum alkaliphilum]|uniref:4-hydroxy-tetrahydrodipicolinate reductase n=1 Tax=Candidatus Syntrophocurvum alkaliphilum TaxID=2293317 RepID=A0A6I6DBI3_9FIRM|nr:4-hydroxy-tetrahydrodipicolinate reductase [Candidatus Syntrophocurvum alkaliphilum]QGT99659.1 4-hydroxy-tetrahydrodipicolinate reductase [Candidatus Syntrophocurvum alkaliphilum]
MAEKIKVIITGALGKMGVEAVKAVHEDNELSLVGVVDVKGKGENFSEIVNNKEINLNLENDLDRIIAKTKPDVMVDFTNPQAVFNNVKTALSNKITCVVGTTGLNEVELNQLEKLAIEQEVGVAVIPNFAIGAVLMMKFAKDAAKYFSDVEVIELHHDQKMDAPSGTAIKTAQMITENREQRPPRNTKEFEKVAGARGGDVNQVRIHSVRLPGFIAHQEVIFGGVGQSLTIRHDSYDRVGFMPGVIMAIKHMIETKGLVYGLENIM